jgi:hypothetical protein
MEYEDDRSLKLDWKENGGGLAAPGHVGNISLIMPRAQFESNWSCLLVFRESVHWYHYSYCFYHIEKFGALPLLIYRNHVRKSYAVCCTILRRAAFTLRVCHFSKELVSCGNKESASLELASKTSSQRHDWS